MSDDPFSEIDSLLGTLEAQNSLLSEFDDIESILRESNMFELAPAEPTTLLPKASSAPSVASPRRGLPPIPQTNVRAPTSAAAPQGQQAQQQAQALAQPSTSSFVAPGMPRLAPVPIADTATSPVVKRRNKRSMAMSVMPEAQQIELSVVTLPAARAQLATVEVLSQPQKATAAKIQPVLPPKSDESRASMVRSLSASSAIQATAQATTNASAAAAAAAAAVAVTAGSAGAAAAGDNDDDDDSSTDSTGDDNSLICTLVYSSEAGKQDQVRAATFNRQVDAMLAPTSAAKGINEFLRTYRAFSSTDQLFHLLRARFEVEKDASDDGSKVRRVRVLAIVNLLLSKHWDHFNHNADLIDDVRAFLDTIEQRGFHAPAQQLRRRLEKSISEHASTQQQQRLGAVRTHFSEPPPLPRLSDMSLLDQQPVDSDADGGDASYVLHVLKWHPEEIARQMTLLEYELYRRVQLPELMNQNWTRAAAHELAPNLTALISHFNRVSQWVQTTVLRHVDTKLRARIVTHFVEVAKHLAALQNFDGVMQFVAAFQSASVSRLKKTWAAQPKATLEELARLKDLLSPQSSFSKLRDALRSANPPAVPYVGMYLADLTFIDEGNDHTVAHEKPLPPGRRRKPKADAAPAAPRDKMRDGLCRKYTLLNTQKFRMIASVLNNFEQYQQAPYNLRSVPLLQYMLRNLLYITDEKRMYALSLAIETRADATADAAALEQWERDDDSSTTIVTTTLADQSDDADPSAMSSLQLVRQLSRSGLAKTKSAFDKLKVSGAGGVERGSNSAAAAVAAADDLAPSAEHVDDDGDDDSGDDATVAAGDSWAGEGEQVLKTGFMRKKGGLRHNWTERWFVLTTSALSYFASRSDTQAKGRILLRDATLGQVKDKGGDILLGLHFQGRTYVMQCKDNQSKAKWVESLSSAIDAAKQRARAPATKQ
jgi:hypothetical protein